jgi:hypothetical protein
MLKQLMEVFEILDRPDASGEKFKEYLDSIGNNNCRVN